MVKGRSPRLRLSLGLGDKSHDTVWDGLVNSVDEAMGAYLDMSATGAPITYPRSSANIHKAIDRISEAYPWFFPPERQTDNHMDLQRYIILKANRIRLERKLVSSRAAAQASAVALPNSAQIGVPNLHLKKSTLTAPKTKKRKNAKQKTYAMGIDRSAGPSQVGAESELAAQIQVGADMQGQNPLSVIRPIETLHVGSAVSPPLSPLQSCTPPAPVTHLGPPPIQEINETVPVKDDLAEWLASLRPSLLHLLPYLVAFGCTDLEHIKTMARTSGRAMVERIIEEMKAHSEKLDLPGAATRKPTSMDWYMLRLAILDMPKD